MGSPDERLVEEIAGILVAIEHNYLRETSRPGSRFEGQRLEVVQARAVIRQVCGFLAPYLDERLEMLELEQGELMQRRRLQGLAGDAREAATRQRAHKVGRHSVHEALEAFSDA